MTPRTSKPIAGATAATAAEFAAAGKSDPRGFESVGAITDDGWNAAASHAMGGNQIARLPATDASGASEVLFVDPSIPDLKTILNNLRPGVDAIVLDDVRPAARQIALALAERRGLSSVHVIAHGA